MLVNDSSQVKQLFALRAAEAGMGLLVLNHLIPGALREVSDQSYIDAVRPFFPGAVVVGRDLQRL
jgi:hypothetical protein